MINQIYALLQPEQLITILVALSAFATVLTLAAPDVCQGDKLRTRMKSVAGERERLRAAQRHLDWREQASRQAEGRRSFAARRDRSTFASCSQAESSRTLLRQAGFRGERHLVTFLALRLITPLRSRGVVFVYSARFWRSHPALHAHGRNLGRSGRWLLCAHPLPEEHVSSGARNRSGAPGRMLSTFCLSASNRACRSRRRCSAFSREIGSQSVPLAEELTLTYAELSYLQDRRKAFDNLGKRTGLMTVKSVVTSLIQSERYGTPLGRRCACSPRKTATCGCRMPRRRPPPCLRNSPCRWSCSSCR